MCFTLRTSTAYCSTERQLRSVCTTTLATFRCTNISPGSRFTISLAGTRLSEQPIQRYSGACCATAGRRTPGPPRAWHGTIRDCSGAAELGDWRAWAAVVSSMRAECNERKADAPVRLMAFSRELAVARRDPFRRMAVAES